MRMNWLAAAVIFTCVCNVLSVAGINYEQYLFATKILQHEIVSRRDFSSATSDGIGLCPILVVLLARRIAPIVLSYASVLFIILIGRIYYLLPSSLTGADGFSLKYDWSDLGQACVGLLSALLLLVWALFRFLMWADEALQSLRERR
ncbi:hypothetical protein JQ557_25085 [Bradyrhizobium sp. U87765 SZCCT0131]|uniref:hypothetical protein n=1 Tax=unclassified Bradyrhizobium TaxID=2631580 RepID=UPI001BA9D6E2|nr:MULTISPECIES: hypothetical protein [unclassified Bradyrhizobium]MBR1221299.1 hypothetical protein [Bradyrhizobium sp. U87765 SZCCT0131]MBR1264778.1 hypothetical protein [Bradyrhizobium sp. U87765 SZCCT0134]MBR1304316.1 hypothetical protein [Bradyrhizobium sp. U87765 SZCCT0110]MBR1322827.1 hypothetical protein [Bradyrhizobium sp. U87765 SZCCT0109]MBR1346245.1 hypothetical protein [Bradyrhizobium sp. U87765 SZCCT0048]